MWADVKSKDRKGGQSQTTGEGPCAIHKDLLTSVSSLRPLYLLFPFVYLGVYIFIK